MRKRKKGRKFGREAGQRKALLHQLAGSFILHGSIVTTEAKAKEAKPVVEKMITRAKRNTLADRRSLARDLPRQALQSLFGKVVVKFSERKGGYARIIKLPPRKSDGARMAKIEFVE